jgi:hypothetical protein
MTFSRARKFIVALIPVLLVGLKVLSDALGDEAGVSDQEWIALAMAMLTSLGVYFVPNEPPGTP